MKDYFAEWFAQNKKQLIMDFIEVKGDEFARFIEQEFNNYMETKDE